MFKSSADLSKLKTNLRLIVNRLKLLEKKKSENALKARKEIADYIQARKEDRGRIKVEHIIREDYMVEAMELIEMYADLLLARFGMIEMQKEVDPGLEEPIATLIWVAPHMQADVAEIRIVAEQLGLKYGQEFASACRKNTLNNVNDKVMHKFRVQAPPKALVEKYMVEIARSYNIPFEPDENALREDEPYLGSLIGGNDMEVNGPGPVPAFPPVPRDSNEKPPRPPGGGGELGTGLLYPYTHTTGGNVGFQTCTGTEKPPLPPNPPNIGFSVPPPPQGYPYNPPPNYGSAQPPSNGTLGAHGRPADPASSTNNDGANTFDDLARRFEELKKRQG